MKILIVEDDFSFVVDVEMLIDQLGYTCLGTVDNGVDAIEFIAQDKPDLILMDIDLNGFLSGIDIARKIIDQEIPVIFMTTFNDETIYQEAMLTNPYGYIVKPFDKISLRSHIERVFKEVPNQQERPQMIEDSFFVKVNEVLKRITYNEVYWIQSDRNYADIYLENKRYSAKISLSKLEQQLNTPNLIRIHKQYIINLKKIQGVTSNDIIINEKHIPIGAKYKSMFFDRLNKI